MAFNDLKKTNLASLTGEIEKLAERQQSFSSDTDNLWRPKLDKASNGYAVLRFLPAPDSFWKKCQSLSALVAPDKFKSYDELKLKLSEVLGTGDLSLAPVAPVAPVAAPVATEAASESSDALSYFEKLANS
jgi:hypothetical protein